MRGLGGRLAALGTRVEARLPALLPVAAERPEEVHRAMEYALIGRGKRVRPVLTLAVAEIFGRSSPPVLDLACAVEMVHACSLVLDDLPSMDDAGLRRGRPTTHRVFGEAVAILAALALLNRAYALAAESAQRLALARYTSEDMIHHLAAAIGSHGLIGGQALDLLSRPEAPSSGAGATQRVEPAGLERPPGGRAKSETSQELDLDRLEYIHSHKTGALFMAAAELGAMAADARRKDLEVVARYAKNLGLAFQISDDLLDVLATPEETGKDAGQDAAKVTFVKLLGVEGAQTLADELLGFAAASLEPLGRKADPLRELAAFVQTRGH